MLMPVKEITRLDRDVSTLEDQRATRLAFTFELEIKKVSQQGINITAYQRECTENKTIV